MAQNFNIVAKLTIQGPNNLNQIVNQVKSQLQSLKADINLGINAKSLGNLRNANKSINTITASIHDLRNAARLAKISVDNLATSLSNLGKSVAPITKAAQAVTILQKHTRQAANDMTVFGEEAAYALRRFAAFAIPTAAFAAISIAFKQAVQGAIDFEVEMIKLSQVTGRSVSALQDISQEITRLSTGLGVSSKDLSEVATTLAQAGLSAKDTKVALEALARSALAATFDNVRDTTEGAIAAMAQFKLEAGDLQGLIGSLNAVSAQFAVESEDLVSVIRRAGGSFQAAGGSLNELLALFTSVRATTRESADSIATGFRTIFTRLQRPRTIQFLKELGVELENSKGQFIGPLESIRRLNAALSQIPTTDSRFSAVIEELGGFRQVSKVIPLIQQFPEAIKALNVAQEGQISIIEDSEIAQKSLANQLTKLREEFFALFREIGQDEGFQEFARGLIDIARNIIEVTKAIKPLIPLIGSLALIQTGVSASSFFQGFSKGLTNPNPRRRFARGGVVPGSGDTDSVNSLLMPGEFVINKKSAKAIGYDKLAEMNRFADGGKVNVINRSNFNREQLAKYIGEITGHETGEIDKKTGEPKVIRKVKAINENEPFDFGIVGLSKGGQQGVFTRELPYKNFAIPLRIHSANLQPEGFGKETETNIRSAIENVTKSVAQSFASRVGAVEIRSDVDSILEKANITSAIGGIFEASLAAIGAPYDKKENTQSIDFDQGLAIPNIKELFGSDIFSKIPTDAKRTADVSSFVNKNVKSFFAKRIDSFGSGFLDEAQRKARETRNAKNAAAVTTSSIETKSEESPKIINKEAALTNFLNSVKSSSSVSPSAGGLITQYLSELGIKRTKNVLAAPDIEKQAINDLKAFLEKNSLQISTNLRQITRKNSGGVIPGSGNSDIVPALLTPGEFVINKKSAQAIGYSQLQDLNRVKKFNKGGPVSRFNRGSRVSGGQVFGGGLGIGAILPVLLGQFTELSSESKGLISSFSAIATSAGILQFQLKSFVNEDKLRKFSASGTSVLGQPAKPGFLGINKVTGSLARNFDTLSLGIGAATGLMASFGDAAKLASFEMVKSAKTEKELNAAKDENKRGSALTAGATGATIGATIGTIIAPGIGTAIGAAVGAIGGAIVGFFNSQEKELQKAFEQARFDRTGELLEEAIENFREGRFSSKAVGASTIASLSKQQIGNIESATTEEQRGSLRKQLRNQLVSFRDAASELAKSSKDFNSFTTNFGGAGKKLIETITSITGDREGAEKEVKGIIDAENTSKRIREAEENATRQIRSYTTSLSEFNRAIRESTDAVQAQTDQFSVIQGLLSGLPEIKFGGTTDVFSRASSGQITNQDVVRKELSRLTGSILDKESAQGIENRVLDVSVLTSNLPSILQRVADKVGFQGEVTDAETNFKAEIENLKIDKGLAQIVNDLFTSQLSSRQNTGDVGIKTVVREDVLALADKLVPEALTVGIKELDSSFKTLSETYNSVINRVKSVVEAEQRLRDERANIIQRQFEFQEQLRPEEDRGRLTDAIENRRQRLLAISGERSLTVNDAGKRLVSANAQIAQLNEQAKNVKLGSPDADALVKSYEKVGSEATRLAAFLKEVSSSAGVLAAAQKELADATQQRQERFGLAEELLLSDNKDKAKFRQTAFLANEFAGGRKNVLDLNVEQRKDVLGLFRKLGKNELFGTGKTGDKLAEEFVIKGVREDSKKGNAPQAQTDALIKQITDQNQKEKDAKAALEKAQKQAIAAQEALLNAQSANTEALKKLNETTLAQLPDRLELAINRAMTSSLEAQVKIEEENQSTRITKKENFDKLENSEVTKAFGGAGNLQQAINNVDLVSKIKENLRKVNILDNENPVTEREKGLLALKDKKTFFGDYLYDDIKRFAPEFVEPGKTTDRDKITAEINSAIEKILAKRKEVTDKKSEFKKSIDEDVLTLQASGVKNINEILATPQAKIDEFIKTTASLGPEVGDVAAAMKTLEGNIKTVGERIIELNAAIKEKNARKEELEKSIGAKGKASGGFIGGKGISKPIVRYAPKGTDTIPTMLAKGEFVVNAKDAKKNSELLELINAGHMANGGPVRKSRQEILAERREFFANKKRGLQEAAAAKREKYKNSDTNATRQYNREKYLSNALGLSMTDDKAQQKLLDTLSNKPGITFKELQKEFGGGGVKVSANAQEGIARAKQAQQESLARQQKGQQAQRDRLANIKAQGIANLKFGAANSTYVVPDNSDLNSVDFGDPGDFVRRGLEEAKDIREGASNASYEFDSYLFSEAYRNKSLTFDERERMKRDFFDFSPSDINRSLIKDRSSYIKDIQPEKNDYFTKGYFDLKAHETGNYLGETPQEMSQRIKSGFLIAADDERIKLKKYEEEGEELSRRVEAIIKASQEGKFLKFAKGGIVPGSGNRDTVPALLTPGERVLTKQQQKQGMPVSLSSESMSVLSAFTNSVNTVAQSFATWTESANRLSDALTNFLNTKIEVTHSPITVSVNVSGMEGLEEAIQQKVLASVNSTLASSKAKAADGRSPFFT